MIPARELSFGQVNALLAPIYKGRVQYLQNHAHLESWDVRRMLNRIFGFAGWSLVETTPAQCIVERPHKLSNGKDGVKVCYRAHLTLIIHTPTGDTSYAGSAVGEATQPEYNVGDAHDQALKSAESGALKRAAQNLGDQFGLSLYNNGSLEPVVQRVLIGSPGVADPPLRPGETPTDDVPPSSVGDHSQPESEYSNG